MAFIALTDCTLKVREGNVHRLWGITKATAVGWCKFHHGDTKQDVQQDCVIEDLMTSCNLNVGDYIEFYQNGVPTDRVYGGEIEVTSSSPRQSIGVKKDTTLTAYYYSA